MINLECEFSAAIIRATKTNSWTDELQIHLTTCSRCQETLEITTMMNRISAEPSARAFPDYRILWMKAQYAKRQERLSTLDLFGLIAVALGGIAGLVGLSAGMFPRPFALLLASTNRLVPTLTTFVSHNVPLGILLAAGFLLWLITGDRRLAR